MYVLFGAVAVSLFIGWRIARWRARYRKALAYGRFTPKTVAGVDKIKLASEVVCGLLEEADALAKEWNRLATEAQAHLPKRLETDGTSVFKCVSLAYLRLDPSPGQMWEVIPLWHLFCRGVDGLMEEMLRRGQWQTVSGLKKLLTRMEAWEDAVDFSARVFAPHAGIVGVSPVPKSP
jgi:hypothetical protein